MRHTEGWPDGARHCLRIGAMSDKQVIEDARESFDVLVIQGNLAISAPQGLASWVAIDKPFWIDPITYAFSASPAYLRSKRADGTTDYKRTFVTLAERYGEPFGRALDRGSALGPDDFPPALIEEAAERILAFQLSVLQPPAGDTKYGVSEQLEPALVTVPFFPLQYPASGPAPPWLDVNIGFVEAAVSRLDPERLAAALLVEPDLVDDWEIFEPSFNAFLDRVHEVGIRHLWLWVSDNDETRMSATRALRLLNMIDDARSRSLKVHQAFGGSFSSFALADGLESLGHGVNYWESKGWEPLATGGLPVARYFYPPLRERLRVPDAVAAVDARVDSPRVFHEVVCNCDTCIAVVKSDIADFGRFGEVTIKTRRTRGGGVAEFDSPTPEALYLTKTHYLRAKANELELAVGSEFDPIARLEIDADRHASDVTRTSHLDTWARAFRRRSGVPA